MKKGASPKLSSLITDNINPIKKRETLTDLIQNPKEKKLTIKNIGTHVDFSRKKKKRTSLFW